VLHHAFRASSNVQTKTDERRGVSPTSSHPTVQLQEKPTFGPPQLDQMVDNSTPSASSINYLLQTIKAQTSIAEEQNRRISKLEQSKK